MGRPYGMLAHEESTSAMGYKIDQIDASVAPPKLTTWISFDNDLISFGKFTGIQSPLSSTNRSDGGKISGCPAAYSTSIFISAGTEFHTVTLSRLVNSAQ